jgi:hypothetical protein
MSTLTSIADRILVGFVEISHGFMYGFFLGSGGVIVGGILSYLLGTTYFLGVLSSDGYLTGSVDLTVVFCVGACLGAAVGVYQCETVWRQRAIFWTTLAGSILGGAIGVGSGLVIDGKTAVAIGCLIGSSIGATIGFDLACRRKIKEYENAHDKTKIVAAVSTLVIEGKEFV